MAYNLVSGTVTSETRRMWGGFIRRVIALLSMVELTCHGNFGLPKILVRRTKISRTKIPVTDHSLVRHVTWGHKTRIDECDLHDKTLPEAWYPGASV